MNILKSMKKLTKSLYNPHPVSFNISCNHRYPYLHVLLLDYFDTYMVVVYNCRDNEERGGFIASNASYKPLKSKTLVVTTNRRTANAVYNAALGDVTYLEQIHTDNISIGDVIIDTDNEPGVILVTDVRSVDPIKNTPYEPGKFLIEGDCMASSAKVLKVISTNDHDRYTFCYTLQRLKMVAS